MKTVAVTGASRGIGRSVAEKFAREGWAVIAIARDAAALAELSKKFPQARAVEADLSDAAATTALAEKLAAEPIDVLVNNAASRCPLPSTARAMPTTRA